jgi:hypothetical protein
MDLYDQHDAIKQQTMYNILKKAQKSKHIPDDLVFLTPNVIFGLKYLYNNPMIYLAITLK